MLCDGDDDCVRHGGEAQCIGDGESEREDGRCAGCVEGECHSGTVAQGALRAAALPPAVGEPEVVVGVVAAAVVRVSTISLQAYGPVLAVPCGLSDASLDRKYPVVKTGDILTWSGSFCSPGLCVVGYPRSYGGYDNTPLYNPRKNGGLYVVWLICTVEVKSRTHRLCD